jgi:hypothetical protein
MVPPDEVSIGDPHKEQNRASAAISPEQVGHAAIGIERIVRRQHREPVATHL